MTLETTFSTWGYGKGAIEERMCTFSLRAWEAEERDKDNSRITSKHDKSCESKKVKVRPSIYTRNQALICT